MENQQVEPIAVVKPSEIESKVFSVKSFFSTQWLLWIVALSTFIDFNAVSILLKNTMTEFGMLSLLMPIVIFVWSMYASLERKKIVKDSQKALEEVKNHVNYVEKKVDDRLHELSYRENDTQRTLSSMITDLNEARAMIAHRREKEILIPAFKPLALPKARIVVEQKENSYAELNTLHDRYKHLSLCATKVPQPYKDRLRHEAKLVFEEIQKLEKPEKQEIKSIKSSLKYHEIPDSMDVFISEDGRKLIRTRRDESDPWVACAVNDLLCYKNRDTGDIILAEDHPRYAKRLDESDGSVFCGKKLPSYKNSIDAKGHVTTHEVKCGVCEDTGLIQCVLCDGGDKFGENCSACSGMAVRYCQHCKVSDFSSLPDRPAAQNQTDMFDKEQERLLARYNSAKRIADTYTQMGIKSPTLNAEAEEAYEEMLNYKLRKSHFSEVRQAEDTARAERAWKNKPNSSPRIRNCVFCIKPFTSFDKENLVCDTCKSSKSSGKDHKISDTERVKDASLMAGTKDLLVFSGDKRLAKKEEPPAEINEWINRLVEEPDGEFEEGDKAPEAYSWIGESWKCKVCTLDFRGETFGSPEFKICKECEKNTNSNEEKSNAI